MSENTTTNMLEAKLADMTEENKRLRELVEDELFTEDLRQLCCSNCGERDFTLASNSDTVSSLIIATCKKCGADCSISIGADMNFGWWLGSKGKLTYPMESPDEPERKQPEGIVGSPVGKLTEREYQLKHGNPYDASGLPKES